MSAIDSWSSQRAALAVEALRCGGQLRLQVHGESMLPSLWPGDLAEIEACSLNQVGRGEIVLAFRDGRFFLHRFLTRVLPQGEHGGFVTRGDSMPDPDPAFPSDALLGKLVGVERAGQSVSSSLSLSLSLAARSWARAMGVLFCHCSFARRIALRLRNSRDWQRLSGTDLETA